MTKMKFWTTRPIWILGSRSAWVLTDRRTDGQTTSD